MSMTGSRPRPAGVSLQQARLCLDCDCLTVDQRCPWCDRSGTVPLAGWFRPMEGRKADATRHGAAEAGAARRWLLIVDHHQRDLYRILRRALAGTGVEVLYERRVGQRRRVAAGPAAGEQRRADRRPAAAERDRLPGRGRQGRERGESPRPRPRHRGSRPAAPAPAGHRLASSAASRPAQPVPHTSRATESTSSSFRRWSSSVMGWPDPGAELNPHWGESPSRSRGT